MNTIVIDNNRISLNQETKTPSQGSMGIEMLNDIYRTSGMTYPKFHKMDALCKLGFIGAHLLFNNNDTYIDGNNCAIVVVGHEGSINTDLKYESTIADPDDYYPSPAIFVYTLANIVTGEIAIKNKIYGETSSFLIEDYDPDMITQLIVTPFNDPDIQYVMGGWIDADNTHISLRFVLIDRHSCATHINKFFKTNPTSY